jgi:hypothetical protein
MKLHIIQIYLPVISSPVVGPHNAPQRPGLEQSQSVFSP